MLPVELFNELSVDGIEFNGDVELTDVGVLWSLKFEAPTLLEEEEALVAEEELVEALEEDLEMIAGLFEHYEEDVNFLDIEEFQIEDDLLFVELIVVDLDSCDVNCC
jgi:hypothetical protein